MGRREIAATICLALGTALLSVGFGMRGDLSYSIGTLFVWLGLAMIVASTAYLLPPRLPIVQRWLRRREERKRATRQRAAQEKLRQEIAPQLKGWPQFHAAAGKVVVLFYALRNREPGVDWESFRDAVRLAINLAGELETFGPRARELLKPFAGVEQDALEHCSADVADLSDWIFMVGRDLSMLRRQAGLPPPRADPPSSTASE